MDLKRVGEKAINFTSKNWFTGRKLGTSLAEPFLFVLRNHTKKMLDLRYGVVFLFIFRNRACLNTVWWYNLVTFS